MAVVRGFYRRWYGPEAEIGDININLLRITDMYFSTDSGQIHWWDGNEWVPWGLGPTSY